MDIYDRFWKKEACIKIENSNDFNAILRVFRFNGIFPNAKSRETVYIISSNPESREVRIVNDFERVKNLEIIEPFQFIMPYHQRPMYRYHGWKKNCGGFELEVDYGSDNTNCASEIYRKIGDDKIYFNRDGSLYSGFEIISHPHSMNKFKEMDFEGMCDILKKYNYRDNARTCGLHVHISRLFFGENPIERDINITKVLYFFQNNYHDIVNFSRRDDDCMIDDYAKFYDFNTFGILKTNVVERQREIGRNYAINLTNPNTIEFRIFNGTIKPDVIRATLEFAFLISKNSKKFDVDDLSKLKFGDWVDGGSKNLKSYCKSVGISL